MSPSFGVFTIIKVAEVAFRSLFPGVWNASTLPTGCNLDIKVEHFVLNKINVDTVFPELTDHYFDNDALRNNHLTSLVRIIAFRFIRLRLLKCGKIYFERNMFSTDVQSRQQATKLMLFGGK